MNPLAILGLRALAIAAAIAALLWAVHRLDESRQQIGYDRRVAEDNAALVKAQAAARATERALNQKLENARHEAAERETITRRHADAARAADERLRIALDSIRAAQPRHLPGDPAAADRELADTLAELFRECTSRYRTVAAAADQHASDAKTLNDGWPR